MSKPIPPLAFMSPNDERQGMYAFLAQFLAAGESIVDVGCGDGSFLAFLRRQGILARGVDHDSTNVRAARARGLDVNEGDAFADRGVADLDAVTMIHLVEHFPPPESQALLHAYAERLRPGGRVIIMTPNYADWSVASNIFWLDPTHVRPYPAALLHQMLAIEGLKVTHTSCKQLVRSGPKQNLGRIIGRMRHGKDFERMNLTVVAERPRADGDH